MKQLLSLEESCETLAKSLVFFFFLIFLNPGASLQMRVLERLSKALSALTFSSLGASSSTANKKDSYPAKQANV